MTSANESAIRAEMQDFKDHFARERAAPLASCDLIMQGGVASGVVYPRLFNRYSANGPSAATMAVSSSTWKSSGVCLSFTVGSAQRIKKEPESKDTKPSPNQLRIAQCLSDSMTY